MLVSHSYGGAVASEAATQLPNVRALVYLNALALDQGESNLGITERFPNEFGKALRPRPFPEDDGYLIGRQDEVISPAAQRFMAKRAKAHTVEINSSHASYIAHPAAVTELILRAARSVTASRA